MLIGIDWSARARYCAFAIGGLASPHGPEFQAYPRDDGALLYAARLQLDALVAFLDAWSPPLESPLTAVLDGRLAEHGVPTTARAVETTAGVTLNQTHARAQQTCSSWPLSRTSPSAR